MWSNLWLDKKRKRKENWSITNSAWQQINDATKTIALANHKSVHCVQCKLYLRHNSFCTRHSKPSLWNTFCWKKKKKRIENGRNKVLKVCYASLSLSACLSDILTPQVSFWEAQPHCQPLCNRPAKSTDTLSRGNVMDQPVPSSKCYS